MNFTRFYAIQKVANPLPETGKIKTTLLFMLSDFINPKAFIRLAGGRGVLGDDGKRAFKSGANAAITDDMLTTAGVNSCKDFELVKGLGFEPHGFLK